MSSNDTKNRNKHPKNTRAVKLLGYLSFCLDYTSPIDFEDDGRLIDFTLSSIEQGKLVLTEQAELL
ncbi:MAG: hypothetical protein JSW12_14075 [Deltaproteobacteria bacterium]|nr:MAG: hypothetical protein JSW12_14075 [Deltaproteobacteria bacterium]